MERGFDMKIEYRITGNSYYDMRGFLIDEGDTVLMDGKERKVYATEDGYLGTDATNPKWIEMGRAAEGEYGIYPFDEKDEPVLVMCGNYTGKHKAGDIVHWGEHECKVLFTWNDGEGGNGVNIVPTGNYGFPLDVYEDKLER